MLSLILFNKVLFLYSLVFTTSSAIGFINTTPATKSLYFSANSVKTKLPYSSPTNIYGEGAPAFFNKLLNSIACSSGVNCSPLSLNPYPLLL